jgi:hypothetical protein
VLRRLAIGRITSAAAPIAVKDITSMMVPTAFNEVRPGPACAVSQPRDCDRALVLGQELARNGIVHGPGETIMKAAVAPVRLGDRDRGLPPHESRCGCGRIFTAKRDRGFLTDVRLNEALHEAAKNAGIRGGAVHFHELRHTYVSLLVAAGVNVKSLQSAMGHTDSRTTTDLYTHLYPEADQSLADALEAQLRQVPNPRRAKAVSGR